MPSIVAAQPEKPNHYTYLKSFRTEQCKEFLQHRCKQHRPFTCFNWHFPNQRRRRPVRKRDGSFNYSPDVYCANYDEAAGTCPDGDGCPFLHRNNGDSERHYHLRYYKTELCVHSVNSQGHCSKNGIHCMFAHGSDDLREPVYDVADNETSNLSSGCGFGSIDGKRNSEASTINDKEEKLTVDPKWNDPQYVLAHYKTERCPKWTPSPSMRVCRLGLMCPYYHSNKDRRRNIASIKYRSIACPMVKSKDDWGDSDDCDRGDSCPYCHTRMELQYHPDVYKTARCDMISKNGHCSKGIFCAFAHDEKAPGNADMHEGATQLKSSSQSESVVGLSDITLPPSSSVKPANAAPDRYELLSNPNLHSDLLTEQNILQSSLELLELAPGHERLSRSSDNGNGFSLAPGAELTSSKGLPNGYGDLAIMRPSANLLNYPVGGAVRGLWPSTQGDYTGLKIDEDSARRYQALPASFMMAPMRGPLMMDAGDHVKRQQILKQQAAHAMSQPLPIGTKLKQDEFTHISSVGSNGGIRLDDAHMADQLDLDFDKDVLPPKFGLNVDPVAASSRHSFTSSNNSPQSAGILSHSVGNGLLDSPDDVKVSAVNFSPFFPPSVEQSTSLPQVVARMKRDLDMSMRRIEVLENEKHILSEERDKAMDQLAKYKSQDASNNGDGHYLRCLHPLSNLYDLSLPLLQQIESQLKSDIQRVKMVILEKANGKCLNCLEKNASLRLPICHHKVLCEICYMKTNECPTCQAAITMPQ